MGHIAWIFAYLKDKDVNTHKKKKKINKGTMYNVCMFSFVFYMSMGECNTILSAYTKYRQLG